VPPEITGPAYDPAELGRELAKMGASLDAVAARVERMESDTNDRFERLIADQQHQFSSMGKRMDADRRLAEERIERNRINADNLRKFNWAPIALTVTIIGLVGGAFGTTISQDTERNDARTTRLSQAFLARVETSEYQRGQDDAFKDAQRRMNDREVEWYRRLSDDVDKVRDDVIAASGLPEEVEWMREVVIDLIATKADHAATLRERYHLLQQGN